MFSTPTEQEAESLIVMACPANLNGEYYARELAENQTLDNLAKFSDKLQYCWDLMQENKKKNEKVSVQRSVGNRKKKHK